MGNYFGYYYGEISNRNGSGDRAVTQVKTRSDFVRETSVASTLYSSPSEDVVKQADIDNTDYSSSFSARNNESNEELSSLSFTIQEEKATNDDMNNTSSSSLVNKVDSLTASMENSNADIEIKENNLLLSCSTKYDAFSTYKFKINFQVNGYPKDTKNEMLEHLIRDKKVFNDDNCILQFINNQYSLKFNECKIGDLIGEDHSNLHNIERVCKYFIEESSIKLQDNEEITLELPGCCKSAAELIRRLFAMILKGKFYRREAEFYNDRRAFYGLQTLKVESGENGKIDKREEDNLRNLKNAYGEHMNEYHKLAENSFFEFFNYKRNINEIDLHNLKTNYENDQIRQKRVAKELKYKRNFPVFLGEAEKRLKARLDFIEKLPTRVIPNYFEIIVGAGIHSKGRQQKIRPAIEDYLQARNIKYTEINKGSLLLTFKHYQGKQPCFGWFYCIKCNKSWSSNVCWTEYYQQCWACNRRCYSFKHQKDPSYQTIRRIKPESTVYRYHSDICGKCKAIGRDCRYESR